MSLDIEQHEAFQRREWAAERVGTGLLVLFVVAGLLGLIAVGPLSWTTRSSGSGTVGVEFDRIAFHESEDDLTLVLGPGAAVDGTVTVRIAGTWPGAVDVQDISPEPSEQRAVPGGMVWVIPVPDRGETEVTVAFRPQEYGSQDARIEVRDESVSFSQFVLP